MNNSKTKIIGLGVTLLMLILSLIIGNQKYAPQSIKFNFEKGIINLKKDVEKKEKCAIDFLSKNDSLASFFETPNQCFYDNNEVGLFIYDNTNLKFWSTNGMIPTRGLFSIDTSYFEQSNSGWFYIKNTVWNNYFIISQGLIKKDYVLTNEYLENNFSSYFNISSEHSLEIDNSQISILCNQSVQGYKFQILAITLFSVSLLIGFILLFFILQKKVYRLGLAFAILMFRLITFYFSYPQFLYDSVFFDPEFYAASEWLPSLGDLWINILVFVGSSFLILTIFPRKQNYYLSGFVFFVGFSIIFWILQSLSTNSSLNLGIQAILEWKIELYLTFTFILILIVFIFTQTYKYIPKTLNKNKIWQAFLFSPILFWIEFLHTDIWNSFVWISLVLICISYLMLIFSKNQKVFNSFIYKTLPTTAALALSLSFIILHYNDISEKERRIVVASRLANEQDPVAEYLFPALKSAILQDSILLSKLEKNDIDEDFFERIAKNYFSGYWLKYALDIYLFQEADSTGLGTEEESPLQSYFREKIEFSGKLVNNGSLYFIEDVSGRINYVAVISFDTYPIRNLYIELNSRVSREGTGYPDLLIDNKMTKPVNISGYSFARYNNGILYQQGGEYSFSYQYKFPEFTPYSFNYFSENGYSHLIYTLNTGEYIILSKKITSWILVLNSFSYLLVILILSILLWSFFFKKGGLKWQDLKTFRLNFTTKIQLAFSLVLLVSMIIVGIGAYNYVINQYHTKNKSIVLEKIRSITFELELDLMEEEELNYENIEFLNFELSRLSNLFFSDINIYGVNGKLISSSRQAVFAESLLSNNIHPQAFKAFNVSHLSEFVNEEKIGKLKFLSAYQPIFNEQRKIIGYLNLPYFLKSRELKEELTASFISLLNVYAILILISLFIVLFLSEKITEPLRMVREKMQKVSISNTNELINYNSNDEIGDLVREYNRMLTELKKSAEILAKNERESAWAEMAKQVAHEVKNPLTPIKLGIQYLDKAWDDEKPDFGERFKKYKNTLIEQIDTLSRIASEFSDFAKVRNIKKESLNITDLLKNCLSFAQNERENLEIKYNQDKTEDIFVEADKEHLIRVINNLLKNAIQAIPEDKMGLVEVSLETLDQEILISISDNGNGVEEVIKDKIFTPNFTTKSTGSGLGLAMCKRIVETAGGEIYFETQQNLGSTFFVKLPK